MFKIVDTMNERENIVHSISLRDVSLEYNNCWRHQRRYFELRKQYTNKKKLCQKLPMISKKMSHIKWWVSIQKEYQQPGKADGLLSMCCIFVGVLSEHNCLLHFLKTYTSLTCCRNTACSTRDAAWTVSLLHPASI